MLNHTSACYNSVPCLGWLVSYLLIEPLLSCKLNDCAAEMNKGGTPNQPTDPNKPPINNDHRPPRPRSDVGNEPNVNPNPNPTYEPPVYPEQYSNSPAKTSMDRPGYGDLGVRPIHAGGSTPSLNRSYEGSQRESGASDQFQGPNTSV